MGGVSIVRSGVRWLGSKCLKQGESVRNLSTALWFTIGSGLFVGWLGIIFAISEGSGMSGAVAVAASGVTFGLLGIAMAMVLSR
jgi:membrane associated rhomboid family serine protease